MTGVQTCALPISKRLVNAPDTTTNEEPASSLDAYDGMAVRLSDETIEKLAEKLAQKLKS